MPARVSMLQPQRYYPRRCLLRPTARPKRVESVLPDLDVKRPNRPTGFLAADFRGLVTVNALVVTFSGVGNPEADRLSEIVRLSPLPRIRE